MSYRDLKNFTEILRSLGYRRLISLENFRIPNFPLVAEILIWFVKCFNPESNISVEYTSSEHRILLIRSVAEFMAVKMNIKLNMKKLYQADGHAVKEMLKIVTLLHESLKINQENNDEFALASTIDLSAKIRELKLTRDLSTQIIKKGSLLFDLLNQEPTFRVARQLKANYMVDINEVELIVKDMLTNTEKKISDVKRQIESISGTENNLDIKLDKKQNDLERLTKRAQTLRKVRPAFLEEFEQLEVELKNLYENYIIRFRCISYFRQQLENLHQIEEEQIVITNPVESIEEKEDYKMQTLENLVYSNSSPVKSSSPTKKKVQGRLKTATERNTMYTVEMDDDSDNNEENDDSDNDDEIDNDDLFDDPDSLLNHNHQADEETTAQLYHSDDLDPDTSHLSDNKSDDEF